MDIPNNRNFCGGNFQDWLEVNLIEECNGKCKWCIEKKGWHPDTHADWRVIAEAAVASGKQNIILLGGEPTLHKDIRDIADRIRAAGRNVWITTNGSKLTPDFISKNLASVNGVNISVHDWRLARNEEITGIKLSVEGLKAAMDALHRNGTKVRMNCNCIRGHVDSEASMGKYLVFAKGIGADNVRFSELKGDIHNFVDLAEVTSRKYGLNDNPFTMGCTHDTVMDGMPVNFRQMCGLQTPIRLRPANPQQFRKEVLYYDGHIYDGWRIKDDNLAGAMKAQVMAILNEVAAGRAVPGGCRCTALHEGEGAQGACGQTSHYQCRRIPPCTAMGGQEEGRPPINFRVGLHVLRDMRALHWFFGHNDFMGGKHVAHEPSLLERIRASREARRWREANLPGTVILEIRMF